VILLRTKIFNIDYQAILLSAMLLSASDQSRLISELLGKSREDYLSYRRQQFNDKQAFCPWCDRNSYYKYGIDKGCQRFKCKDCGRTFTEYTGTWLDGLHKKSQVVDYIELMIQGKSLDKISAKLCINKKTAFDWRHKILSSLEQDRGNEMAGIVESDETFFEESEKGNRSLKLKRPGRKRGSSASEIKKRGISDNKVAVIATADRGSGMSLCVAAMGRICKDDISCSIAGKLPETTILCTDGHVSYKGFAKDNKLNHVVLRADLNQHVKLGVYHIQNVNSIHHRLKKWIDNTFWGVSTKYMQNYLGWFRLNEKLKGSASFVKDFFDQTMQDTDTLKRYSYIDISYQWLLATQ
jgi:transposase-like protein